MDHSSFGKRLATIPSEYFEAVFQNVYKNIKDHLPADRTAHTEILRLRRVDATAVTLSAKLLSFGLVCRHFTKKKAAPDAQALPEIRENRLVKTVFELDEDNLPLLLHVCQDQSEASDNKALGKTMLKNARENDLFVFDKAFTTGIACSTCTGRTRSSSPRATSRPSGSCEGCMRLSPRTSPRRPQRKARRTSGWSGWRRPCSTTDAHRRALRRCRWWSCMASASIAG